MIVHHILKQGQFIMFVHFYICGTFRRFEYPRLS